MTPNIESLRQDFTSTNAGKGRRKGKTKRRASSSSSDKENEVAVVPNVSPVKSDTTTDNNNHAPLETVRYNPDSMDFELNAGVDLITRFISKSAANNEPRLSRTRVEAFKNELLMELRDAYTGHWYPSVPEKGSAFRCLRINQSGSSGSLIEKAASKSGHSWMVTWLPKEFTIWIDPGEVSYRIGEDGSICVHFSKDSLNQPDKNLSENSDVPKSVSRPNVRPSCAVRITPPPTESSNL